MKRNGFEPEDDSKVAVPVKFRAPPGEVDRLREMMGRVINDLRGRDDVESFEESLDFEVEDDDPTPVSQSEQRYMTEEKLLTEQEEAARVVLQRRAAANFRRQYGRGKEGSDAKPGGVGGRQNGAGDSGEKRDSPEGQAWNQRDREAGVRKAGDGDSGVVAKG